MRMDRLILLTSVFCGAVIFGVGSLESQHLQDVKCHPDYFECTNAMCIKASLRCNLADDCGDNSDEENCRIVSRVTSCPEDAYLCKSPPKCVPLHDLCSDFNECTDYDQIEKLCPVTCQPHKFKCLNVSQCVSKKYLCDGRKDCEDDSDELRCDDEIYKCREESDSFLCDDHSNCISDEFVCDGHEMCNDGSDEKHDCYKLCQAKNCGPNQQCLPEGRGVKCVCKDGYKFDKDKKDCIDMTYCNVSDLDRPCSQDCIEGHLRAHCRCVKGYTLNRDGHTCDATGSEAILYISNASDIYQWSLKSQRYTTLVSNLPGVNGLAFDSTERRIFWSETGTSQPEVMSLNVEGKKTKRVVASFGLQKPGGLAYDYITKSLYVVDSGIPAILACDPEQELCIRVFNSTVVNSPKDIAIHPSKGLLYFTEMGNSPIIMRGSMDGSSSDVFVKTSILHPVSLFVDETTNRLYWIDAVFVRIYNVDLDGTGHRSVLGHKISFPSAISIFEDTIFWANQRSSDVIMSANKFTGVNTHTVIQNITHPTALMIEHQSLQNGNVINPCGSKRCHLCLLNDHETASCFCSPGFKLDETEEYCESEELKPNSFLLASHENMISKVPLNGTGRLTPSYIRTKSMNSVYSLAYLSKTHEILYSDVDTRINEPFISKVQGMDGSAQSVMVVKDLSSVQNMAVDEASSVVFWTDAVKKSINVASLDGSYRVKLPIDVAWPCGLSIESIQGLLYYSELRTFNTPAVIRRCRLDGQSCANLVSDKLFYPSFILAQGQQLYWSDYGLGEISSINQWGGDQSTIVITHGKPLSFAVDQSIIYWTEEDKNIIFYRQIHKDNGVVSQLETNGGPISSLIAAIPHSQPKSACSFRNGGCEHICISIKRSVEVSCLCTVGFHLHQDGKQCVKSDRSGCVGFFCKSENFCLEGDRMCNGISDCDDASDEDMCPDTSTCSKEEFRCDNSQCISKDFMCDGESDCKDGSDEKFELCPNSCSSGYHFCDDNNCVPVKFACDKDQDCIDGSDEINCEVTLCNKEEFLCRDGQCIADEWVCDGISDCKDGDDEVSCKVTECKTNQYKCKDGECIDHSEVCDQIENCGEGEDEQDCTQPKSCAENEFECYDGSCIDRSALCNNINDCKSREDEAFCDNVCTADQFQCQDGLSCIPIDSRCNKVSDCTDGSDEGDFCIFPLEEVEIEQKCQGFVCAVLHHCIDASKRCDGTVDCRDNTDEFNCRKTCRNDRCSQICVDTLSGVECRCRQGYRLMSDGIACEDVNECLDQNGGCSHKCLNIKRTSHGLGFKCQCFDGFVRGQDYYSCKVRGQRPTLYISTSIGIKDIAVEGHELSTIISTQTMPVKMEVDIQQGLVYFAEFVALSRGEMHLWKTAGVGAKVIFTGVIVDMALDWITDNMYLLHMVNSIDMKISVLNSDGLVSSLVSIRCLGFHLIVHPAKGFMFWMCTVPHLAMMKASMDGSDVSTMVQASYHMSEKPSLLSFDHTTERLYWVNQGSGQLKSVTIADSDVYTYDLHTNAHRLVAMDIFEGIAYFTSEDNIVLSFAMFKTGKRGVTTVKRLSHPNKVKVYHHLKQPVGVDACASKECMYMCVKSSSGGARCLCPDKYRTHDNPDCEGPNVSVGSVSPMPPPLSKRPPFIFDHPLTVSKQNKSLIFSPKCPRCLNGGKCVRAGSTQSCRCPKGFKGPLCEKRRAINEQEEETEDESYAWLAALIIGVLLVLLCVLAGVWFFRYRRHNRSIFNTIRFKKHKKFVVCTQDDKVDLVPEISFGNPGFQDEIDEEADMQGDHEWWKKLITRSRRSVESGFHSKNSSERSIADNAIDQYLRGDPQDPVMSDKVRLLK